MKPRPLLVQIAMLTTMLLWGVSFVASKLVLGRITPLTYMGLRFLIASAALAVVMMLRGRPRFTPRVHLRIALTALAEPVAYFLFESYGVRLVSATTASLLIATVPLAVMMLAAVFLGEPLRRSAVVAVSISIAGVVLLVLGSDDGVTARSDRVLGIVLILGAVLSAALYITQARHLTQRHDPVNITIIQTWWGAGVFGLLWRLQPASARSADALGSDGWVALMFLAFGATVGAFLLYNWALRHETAGTASLYINAIPVVTAVAGWLILDERLTPLQLVGAALVLIAVRIGARQNPARVEAIADAVPPEA